MARNHPQSAQPVNKAGEPLPQAVTDLAPGGRTRRRIFRQYERMSMGFSRYLDPDTHPLD